MIYPKRANDFFIFYFFAAAAGGCEKIEEVEFFLCFRGLSEARENTSFFLLYFSG
jgi:hypothetical protein